MALPRLFKSLNIIRFLACATTAALTLASASVAPASAQGEAAAAQPQEVPLAAGAPSRYVVKRGDTLWDIAAKFLRDPWFWPEIWYVNPQVENPHLIYPGDELVLVYVDGKPRVMLERGTGGSSRLSPRVRSEPLSGAIASIPYDVIAAFMRRPAVFSKEQIDGAPYVVRTRDEHLIAAAGNDAYVRGLKGAIDDEYSFYSIGVPLKDPDDGALLGYEGVYNATGRVTRLGDPATVRLTESARETVDGDRLLPSNVIVSTDFLPRAPDHPIEGRIMSTVDSALVVGTYQFVVINRGKRDGLETGHTLGIWRVGDRVEDNVKSSMGSKVKLPDERSGVFIVFRVFDRLSYGLVMGARIEIRKGDIVRNP